MIILKIAFIAKSCPTFDLNASTETSNCSCPALIVVPSARMIDWSQCEDATFVTIAEGRIWNNWLTVLDQLYATEFFRRSVGIWIISFKKRLHLTVETSPSISISGKICFRISQIRWNIFEFSWVNLTFELIAHEVGNTNENMKLNTVRAIHRIRISK